MRHQTTGTHSQRTLHGSRLHSTCTAYLSIVRLPLQVLVLRPVRNSGANCHDDASSTVLSEEDWEMHNEELEY